MRTTAFVVLLAAGMWLAPHSARAHHSFAAEFDIRKPVTLTGILTRMDWVNPHGWIHVDVKAVDGRVEQWSVQTGGPTQLLRRGFGKDDFRAGIEITIEGYRARNGSLIAHGETVTFKDGRNLFIGEIPIK